MTLAELDPRIPSPYPGLRPFESYEADIFFGRGAEISDMLRRLESNRFLAVVGASGSGKSSLVRAGAVPMIEQGFLLNTSTDWLTITMRPGQSPFANLAAAYHQALKQRTSPETSPARPAFTEAVLRSGPAGLVEALGDARLATETHILLLVDQFEEIFRFRHRGVQQGSEQLRSQQRNEAAAFVKLLLATARQSKLPVYVMLTMRSDFLGDCDAFQGLPNAINDSQFLTPRMTRDQLDRVIREPVRLFGGQIQEELVNRILNDVGTEPDQLPLMQHALLRTWDHARSGPRVAGVERSEPPVANVELTVDDYLAVGTITDALSMHADEAWHELSDKTTGEEDESPRQRIARKLFCCLSDRGAEARLTRRLVTVREVAEVAEADIDTVLQIVETFRAAGRSFLTTPDGSLTADSTLDISHESLMRQWRRLAGWLAVEEESARTYRRIVDQARHWDERGRQADRLWIGSNLEDVLDWKMKEAPNAKWAERYDRDGFELAEQFITASEEHNKQIQDRRTMQTVAAVTAMIIISLLALTAWRSADTAKKEAANARTSEGSAKQSANTAQRNLATSYLLTARAAGERKREEQLHWYWRAYDAMPNDDVRRRNSLNVIAGLSRRIELRLQHEDSVTSVAFSPDGTRVLTGCYDGAARLWDATSGEPITEPLKHEGVVTSVAFSPDGTRVLTGSDDNSARVWHATSGKPITEPLEHERPVYSVAFSPDGTRVLTGSWDNSARVWHATSGEPITEPLEHESFVYSVAFSPDGTRVLTGSHDNSARVWHATSGEPITEPLEHESFVYSVAFSPDGTRVLTGSADNTARVWDATSGEPITEPLKHDDTVNSVAFSPDGTRVLTGSWDNSARVWDATSGEPITEPLKHDDTVGSVAFSPDGTRVLTGSADNTARVWDATSGAPITEPLKHEGYVTSVAFSPDGTRVLTGSADKTARVWDATSGQPITEPLNHDDTAGSVAFSPDGTRVLTGSADNTARVWDATSGAPITEPLEHERPVYSVAFSPDGTRVLTGSEDKTARVWDATSSEPITDPLKHEGAVTSVAFSPDGTRVLTGSFDNTARVWDATSGEPITEPLKHEDEVYSVAFSSDGTRVLTGSDDNTARVWDATSGEPITDPLKHEAAVLFVAFSADGTRVLTGSYDNTARVWDATSGAPITEPLKHEGYVTSVAFSPDGTRVLTGSEDKTARVWDAASGEPITEPLQHEGRVYSVAYSPDGTRVLTGSADDTARVWDATSGEQLIAPLKHEGAVVSVAFSPDGTRVLTGSSDSTARIWTVPPPALDDPRHPDRLRLSVEVRTGWYVDDGGTSKRLRASELLERRKRLAAMGGPCDVRSWDDVSAAEKALLRKPPPGR